MIFQKDKQISQQSIATLDFDVAWSMGNQLGVYVNSQQSGDIYVINYSIINMKYIPHKLINAFSFYYKQFCDFERKLLDQYLQKQNVYKNHQYCQININKYYVKYYQGIKVLIQNYIQQIKQQLKSSDKNYDQYIVSLLQFQYIYYVYLKKGLTQSQKNIRTVQWLRICLQIIEPLHQPQSLIDLAKKGNIWQLCIALQNYKQIQSQPMRYLANYKFKILNKVYSQDYQRLHNNFILQWYFLMNSKKKIKKYFQQQPTKQNIFFTLMNIFSGDLNTIRKNSRHWCQYLLMIFLYYNPSKQQQFKIPQQIQNIQQLSNLPFSIHRVIQKGIKLLPPYLNIHFGLLCYSLNLIQKAPLSIFQGFTYQQHLLWIYISWLIDYNWKILIPYIKRFSLIKQDQSISNQLILRKLNIDAQKNEIQQVHQYLLYCCMNEVAYKYLYQCLIRNLKIINPQLLFYLWLIIRQVHQVSIQIREELLHKIKTNNVQIREVIQAIQKIQNEQWQQNVKNKLYQQLGPINQLKKLKNVQIFKSIIYDYNQWKSLQLIMLYQSEKYFGKHKQYESFKGPFDSQIMIKISHLCRQLIRYCIQQQGISTQDPCIISLHYSIIQFI